MDQKLVEIAKFINNISDVIPTIKKIYIDSKNDSYTISKYLINFLGNQDFCKRNVNEIVAACQA